MDGHSPRFNFFSLTFFVGFGIGSFLGVLLGLVALALVRGETEITPVVASAVEPTAIVAAAAPGITATPEPRPRTKSALDVRLGPGEAFAVIGTIAKGSELEPVGRDNSGEWVAVRFPPGSAARGWLPVDEIESLSEVGTLAVVAPTPLPRTSSPPTPSINTGAPAPRSGAAATATPRPAVTAAAAAAASATATNNTGPADLVVSRATLLADGRVQVVVGNRGPGDVIGKSIFVIVRDLTLRSEQLVSQQGVPVGSLVTLQTSTFRVEREMDIQVIVDPFRSISDPDTTNNQLSLTLAPAPPARGSRD
jgi:hypothetical protein